MYGCSRKNTQSPTVSYHCDVDLPIVSFDFVPNLGYPLRVGELLVDARCDPPMLEP